MSLFFSTSSSSSRSSSTSLSLYLIIFFHLTCLILILLRIYLLFYCSFSSLSSRSVLYPFPSSPSHFTSKFLFLNILYLLSPLYSFIYSSCFFFYMASFNISSSFLLLSFLLCSLFYNVLHGATVTKLCAKDKSHK